jgi:hypothetical protein
MRLVDFLIALLEAHAQALHGLGALLGEEELIEAIDAMDGAPAVVQDATEARAFVTRIASEYAILKAEDRIPNLSSAILTGSSGDPYRLLEGAVRGFNLTPVLEFYLWTYPLYRAYIECSLPLDWVIPSPGTDLGTRMVEDAVVRAERWMQLLMLPRPIAMRAEQYSRVPWLKFRANALKRAGRRPLGPVY